MLRGLYTAVSAMQTTEKKIDVISNNMANANTTSFKKDLVITETFPEVLLHKINGQLPPEAFNAGARVTVNGENGVYRLTANGGFFAAHTPNGISYNRETHFAVDENGFLRTFSRDIDGKVDTSQGNYILDANRQAINVGDEAFEVDALGRLLVNGEARANLITRGGPNTIGTMNSGLRLNKIETNFTQGSLEATGNNLDFAIQGDGFFKVTNLAGDIFYTRNGNFTLNNNGEIVTSEGHFLLSEAGGSILVDGLDFQVTDNGGILVNNQIVDQIDLVDIVNERMLRKQGESYYRIAQGEEVETRPFTGEILQGYLEGSNVNVIKEMVEMITAYRNYESNQKVVKAYDELLQRAVNDIGKL